MTFSFSKNSTVCQSPIPPAANKHANNISTAVPVIALDERFQHPDNPVQNAQNTTTKLQHPIRDRNRMNFMIIAMKMSLLP